MFCIVDMKGDIKVFLFALATAVVLMCVPLFIGLLLGWNARGAADGGSAVYSDTVTVVDTIPYYRPVSRDSTVVRYETVRLCVTDTVRVTVGDTVRVADSVEVIVPITQKVYADSLYRAYVSGYRPRLDSIFIYPRTRYVTVTRQAKPQRWGIGVQAGYGVGRGGTGPYLGVGVSYNFLTF